MCTTRHLNNAQALAVFLQSDASQCYLFARGNLWRADYVQCGSLAAELERRAKEQQEEAARASARIRQLLNITE